MSNQVLDILKLSLLALLYLFFARVLWAVWSEVKTPQGRPVAPTQSPQPASLPVAAAPPDAANKRNKPAKGRGGRAARLVILEPKHRRGVTIALGDEITLGRDENCTISIQDDTYVSTLHLRIYSYDGQPMIEDLGSTNGTFHNGTRMHGTKLLQPGDRIQVGTTVIEAQ